MPAAMGMTAARPYTRHGAVAQASKTGARTRAIGKLPLLSPAQHTIVDLGGVIGHGADKVQALGYDGPA